MPPRHPPYNARKALLSLVPSLRRHSHHHHRPTAATEAEDFGRDRLVLRFSDLVKHLSKKLPPPHSPEPGARPRHPNPFDYANLMKRFARAGHPDEVLRLFDEMRHYGCSPDLVCYTTLADALVTADRPAEAVAVFLDMHASGILPDTAAYTVLLKMYACHLNQFDSAYEVVRWMASCGCRPDVVAYSTLVAGLCRAGRVEEALGVLDQMLEEQCCPNAHTYTPIVQAYCSLGRIREARRLLDTMERIGCATNTVTYNVLIEALCTIGSFDEVEKVLNESTVKGWKPDAFTYSIYMDGLCKWGRADEAFGQLEVMMENGVCPNAVTLNILLDCLCQGSRVWEAKILLERSNELDWHVGVVNYNTVMRRLCASGRCFSVLKLFTDMLKKGVVPNVRTFGILIHSLCRAGKLRLAKCIFSSRGFIANVVIYTTLIRYFYLAGRMDEVGLLFFEMTAVKKIAPNKITYGIMIDCFCRDGKFLEAFDCFDRSLGGEFSSDLAAHLTYELIRGGRIAQVLSLFEGMSKHGLNLDTCIFSSLIKAFCREGFCQSRKIHAICLILDKMLCIKLISKCGFL